MDGLDSFKLTGAKVLNLLIGLMVFRWNLREEIKVEWLKSHGIGETWGREVISYVPKVHFLIKEVHQKFYLLYKVKFI